MADHELPNTPDAAAEKAYAAAAEKAVVHNVPVEQPAEAVVVEVKAAKAEPAPAEVHVAAAKKPAPAKPVRKPVAVQVAQVEDDAKEAVADGAAKVDAKAANIIAKIKDSKVAATTKKTAEELSARVQGAVKDAQDRAKTALEKSQALLADVGEFTKGNLGALAESGKILRTGVQAFGKAYVETAKSTVDIVQADIKELRAAKSPSEFVKLQGTLVRKHFDTARANNSKRTEAARKLANEAIKPLSNRVTVAREKLKKAA
jgi:phasin family protein